MEPTRGLVFEHTRWLDEAYQPLLMRVTKLARGTIYYRALDGSFSSCCPIEDFDKFAQVAPPGSPI